MQRRGKSGLRTGSHEAQSFLIASHSAPKCRQALGYILHSCLILATALWARRAGVLHSQESYLPWLWGMILYLSPHSVLATLWILAPFYRWANWGKAMLDNTPKRQNQDSNQTQRVQFQSLRYLNLILQMRNWGPKTLNHMLKLTYVPVAEQEVTHVHDFWGQIHPLPACLPDPRPVVSSIH